MNRRYRARRYPFIVVFAVTAACAGVFWTGPAESAWNFVVPAVEVKPQNGVFAFPQNAFADGKAKHFEYKHSPSQWVRFFVVKSSDGTIRAAFDACDVCWRHKKGYAQQGNFMVCINCGLKFRTDKVNEVKGGCNPSPLKRTIQGDNVIVTQQDVMSGQGLFQ
ncbi:MAG: DUF2318 domain-containing protein [Desulfomonilaceae bacterium]|nr:DUF2318 domain-containing protein [Desulfomonilaceae bacterium]